MITLYIASRSSGGLRPIRMPLERVTLPSKAGEGSLFVPYRVGVNRGGLDAGMAQPLSYETQSDALTDRFHGKGMSKLTCTPQMPPLRG